MSHSRTTAIKEPKTLRANNRVVGDDWSFYATTPANLADWENVIFQLKYKSDGVLIADSQGESPTLLLDGVDEQDRNIVVPASEFEASGGVLHLVVLREVTRGIEPSRDLVLQGSVDAISLTGRRTWFTAEFTALAQVAIEVAP